MVGVVGAIRGWRKESFDFKKRDTVIKAEPTEATGDEAGVKTKETIVKVADKKLRVVVFTDSDRRNNYKSKPKMHT